jgi:hypothetical protein
MVKYKEQQITSVGMIRQLARYLESLKQVLQNGLSLVNGLVT